MPDYTSIEQIDSFLTVAGETTIRHGNLIRRAFLKSGERYLFDNALDLSQWLQFDTESDAWYFGVWVNKATAQYYYLTTFGLWTSLVTNLRK